jgi:hypothetical protein
MLVRLGFPLGAHQERDRGERHMPDEHDRSGIDVDRADRALIEQAAARLRQGAIRAGYAGMEHKHFAFALALVLDELARHVRDLRPEVREQTLRGVRMLLG